MIAQKTTQTDTKMENQNTILLASMFYLFYKNSQA